jgi:Flp pilus assembly protein TadB
VRIDELYDLASEETRRLVHDLLKQDAADRAWAGQVGPALTQADTARQAREKRGRLIRWREMAEAPALAVVLAAAFLVSGSIPLYAVPFLLAWFLSPLVAEWTATARERVEARLKLMEEEEKGGIDLSKFYVRPDVPPRLDE